MEVTKLSNDTLEILLQLNDSKADILNKINEIEKQIKEHNEVYTKVTTQLSNLDKRYAELKNNDKKNLTTIGTEDEGEILREVMALKKEKEKLEECAMSLYDDYIYFTNERTKVEEEIKNVLEEGEIETLTLNQGIEVQSLNTKVHIKDTDISKLKTGDISKENCEISETTFNIINEIIRKFKENEEEYIENRSPHEMLMELYNSRNRQKEEKEEFISRIPKYIKEFENNNEEISENENTENSAIALNSEVDLKNVINSIDNNTNIENEYVKESNNVLQEQLEDNNIDLNLQNVEDNNIDLNLQNTEDNTNIENENIEETNDVLQEQLENNNISSNESYIPTIDLPKVQDNYLNMSDITTKIDNNVPLNEDEINSILSSGKSVNSGSDKVIINIPMNPSKIANSSENKISTILNVWSKYEIPKTEIINGIKKEENMVPLDSILSTTSNDKNTGIDNIQSFFSNSAQ